LLALFFSHSTGAYAAAAAAAATAAATLYIDARMRSITDILTQTIDLRGGFLSPV